MSLFAVFDGHGGKEVAKFCERRFCEEFVLLPQFRSGDYSEALRTCFHKAWPYLPFMAYRTTPPTC
jgi:serine/threonine protein phosphatase PrpC